MSQTAVHSGVVDDLPAGVAIRSGRGLDIMLALDSTTLSRTLRPLEEKGWVRWRPGSDRRERHWDLTPGGRRKLAEAVPAWERAQRELRSRFGGAGWQALMAGLTHAAEVSREE
jgi:DNA-binding MarR family transcriptional regulator